MADRSSRPESLSGAQARRIALAAQGFANTPRLAKRRPFDQALAALGALQLDSVNVFVRSHYLPVFSRHGRYDPTALDRHLWSSGELTEYWAHEAALIPVADRPLFAWRMDEYRERYADRVRATASLAATIDRVRAQLADGGPQLVRELEQGPRSTRGPWWDWSDTKRAVEILFAWGEVVAAGREGFQRRYALAADLLPDRALGAVPRADAQRALIERAARSLGVATLPDLADYFRIKPADARPAVSALVEAGRLIPVQVEGWQTPGGRPIPAWLHADARIPARLAPDALLTPFDPVVWFRPRAERLFDFHYRIEIYTPKQKRQYGYYCLPLLVSGSLAGRIDLKADRASSGGSGALLVQAAWLEPGARDPLRVQQTAIRLLQEAARWQGLDEIKVSGVGDLALPTRFDP